MDCSLTDCDSCPYYDVEYDECKAPEPDSTIPLDELLKENL